MEAETNIERGMGPGEARLAVVRNFGNLSGAWDLAYEIRGGESWRHSGKTCVMACECC
jgi:hypothetical protein